jgi:DNA-binding NarL/FixJ family response regulator
MGSIMNRIIMLNDDLESQMRMYLALCPRYRIEIAENEVTLMRLIRRKRPALLLLDANHSRLAFNGKSPGRLIEKIKQKYHSLHVLAIVRDGDEDFGHTLQQRGADGWVDHMIEADKLRDQVDHVLSFPAQSPPELEIEEEEAVV